jgi:hypothetical protein
MWKSPSKFQVILEILQIIALSIVIIGMHYVYFGLRGQDANQGN